MLYSFALSQFLHAPFHSAAKTCASAFPPQLPLLHICDPAGVGITAMWRSRIADRYNAPRSVSRVRSGFRDDYVGGVCGKKLPQCCLPLLALRSLKTLRALSLGKNKCAVLCVEIADSRPLQRSTFRIACALWLPR